MVLSDLFDLTASAHAELFCNVLPWQVLKNLPRYLKDHATARIEGEVHPTAILDGEVWIAAGAIIGPGAILRGPCIVGPRTRVGDALIRSAIVGADCIVGHCCEVARSVLLNGVQVFYFNLIADSIIGNRVHIGGGTLTANSRLDGSEVSIHIGNQRYTTGLTKLGSLIGDDCELGAQCLTMPGAILGRGCVVFPGVHLSGCYPHGCRIRVIQSQQVKERS